MKIVDNIVYAENEKQLKTPYGFFPEFKLGDSYIIVNGKSTKITLTEDLITEVIPVRLNDDIYLAESTTYPELVTELIRKKYSLDDELALMANSRLEGNEEKEIEFLNWRKLCKETAKKVLNG